jgi:putative iron-regulated protein
MSSEIVFGEMPVAVSVVKLHCIEQENSMRSIITNRLRALSLSLMITTGVTMPVQADVSVTAVIKNYADIALASYEDSLATAKYLDDAIKVLLAKPSAASHQSAKDAWLAARVYYQQTEVFRFGNAIVDDWEGRVNAWPLDEGLIDYVDKSYGAESDENSLYTANVIANPSITIKGKPIDAAILTPALLSGILQEAGGIEANVATGYHAIEFLLWGQDLNGTEPGAGDRSHTDFDTKNCTNGNCDRRAQYLVAASVLLVTDLEEMVGNWTINGAARQILDDQGAIASIRTIIAGMGSLSYGELAGQRMKLGLLLHDPEEEHDCFSDNTHNSHLYDAKGIRNVYTGEYTRIDGTKVSGPSLSSYVAEKEMALDAELLAKLDATMSAMEAMRARAQNGEAYDQMIGEGNDAGNKIVQTAIDGLVSQTRTIERIITSFDLGNVELEGSDSLDKPNAVFK